MELHIDGSGFNITGIFVQPYEENLLYGAEVAHVNQYGFFEITLDNKKLHLKRHISKCDDLIGMCYPYSIHGLHNLGDTYVLDVPEDYEEVYFIQITEDGTPKYVTRKEFGVTYTEDITDAWFTFDKGQALNIAAKFSMKKLIIHNVVDTKKAITLSRYETI